MNIHQDFKELLELLTGFEVVIAQKAKIQPFVQENYHDC